MKRVQNLIMGSLTGLFLLLPFSHAFAAVAYVPLLPADPEEAAPWIANPYVLGGLGLLFLLLLGLLIYLEKKYHGLAVLSPKKTKAKKK